MGDWLIRSVLNEIERQMMRLYFNKYQKEMEYSPFRNTGTDYFNNTFEVRAYSWDDDEDIRPNFKYKGLEIFWYKHCDRGLQWYYNGQKNVLPESWFLEDMLQDCLESLEIEFDKFPNI